MKTSKTLIGIGLVILGLPFMMLMMIPLLAVGIGGGDKGGLQNVPTEFVEIVTRAGSICPEIPPHLVAGMIEQESGWNQDVISPAGAVGIAQFMPETWQTHGKRASDDGNPPDIHNPHDQIWSLGNLMCYNIALSRTYIDTGLISGDLLELALAMYNAGPGNVLDYGGIPPFTETQNYVKQVQEKAKKYLPDGPSTANGNAILEEARKYLGVPYVWGGSDPNTGLDCSGFVQLVFSKFGIGLPRTADQQAHSSLGTIVSIDSMQPGDVIFFKPHGPSIYTHVAIYIGRRNGEHWMINAETFGVPLRETSLETPYWQSQQWLIKRLH